jgi:DNA-directed RNA polymerase specialized sigma24 family protein
VTEPTANSTLKKDWTPTEPALQKFLQWLDQGTDSKGERYLEMRHRLVRYFDQKHCFAANDLADETLNRVTRRLEEQGTISEATPAQYCYIVAKFVFLEYVRQPHPQGGGAELHFNMEATARASRVSLEASEMAEKRLECLDRCLAKLVQEERGLILDYYRGEQQEKIRRRRELAERLRLTLNALSIRACRIRVRIEACVGRCCQES